MNGWSRAAISSAVRASCAAPHRTLPPRILTLAAPWYAHRRWSSWSRRFSSRREEGRQGVLGGTGTTDPYALLAVGRDAGESEIKAAFRRKALKLHPDVRKASTPEEANRHREEFVELLWAASVLSDRQSRAVYDRSWRSAGSPNSDSDYEHPLQRASSRAQRRTTNVWDEKAPGGRGWSYTAASGRRTSGDSDPPNRGEFGARGGGHGAHRGQSAEGAEVPRWLSRYEEMVSQGVLHSLLDPVRVHCIFVRKYQKLHTLRAA
jgi:curved DNA-binding protein CbpA